MTLASQDDSNPRPPNSQIPDAIRAKSRKLFDSYSGLEAFVSVKAMVGGRSPVKRNAVIYWWIRRIAYINHNHKRQTHPSGVD